MKTTVNTDLIAQVLNSSGFSAFLKQYHVAMTVFLAVCTLLILMLLIGNITKLAVSGAKEEKRRESAEGILICFFALAAMGGMDTLYGIVLLLVFGNR